MSNVERIRAVLEPALSDAVAATFIADAEDPIAFLSARLGSRAAEELTKQLADRLTHQPPALPTDEPIDPPKEP